MAKLILNLHHVLQDEADDIRALLDARGIAFYETQPSIFGVSFGGVWVKNDADYPDAMRALHEYEQERSTRVRAAYAAAQRDGTAPTFLGMLRADPLRVILTIVGALLALAVAAIPVVLLFG